MLRYRRLRVAGSAHAVGAAGWVLGLDVAEPALVLGRAKAQTQGMSNVEFRAVDVEHTGLPSESFDAVVCVFGVFFLPDIAATIAELWRLVRPGGVLAVTVWGHGFLVRLNHHGRVATSAVRAANSVPGDLVHSGVDLQGRIDYLVHGPAQWPGRVLAGI